MIKRIIFSGMLISLLVMSVSCAELDGIVKKIIGGRENTKMEEAKEKVDAAAKTEFTGAKGEVKIMTLDPGHFHSSLVQKTMYEQVSPRVHVYAPAGPEVNNHLKQINAFNNRSDNPTSWQIMVYRGDDFFERMVKEKPGNVVVISGNNRKKAQYIKACVEAGLNVLADKPMCIDAEGLKDLKEAFAIAKKNNVLIYDIMTERSEITTRLQKELIQNAEVFGEQDEGSVDNPAVERESIHHFFKYVAGNPLKRPGWYFDTTQQGEGLVDITTHLADIIMWQCFPGEVIDYSNDVKMKKASRFPTMITRQQYNKVTGLDDFPSYLKAKLNEEGVLPCFANGEMIYSLKGVHTKITVKWNFQAPEGAGDTQYSMVRGTNASIIVRQGKEQNYKPEVYIKPARGKGRAVGQALRKAIAALQDEYPGLEVERQDRQLHLVIPEKLRTGHEAHFGEVTERYLQYLVDGKLPDWEVPNMIAKNETTIGALKLAGRKEPGVVLRKSINRVDVMIDGKLFTSYQWQNKLTKPVLYPVNSPSGIVLNRGYPLVEVEGERKDHPHHVGLFFTYDLVNGEGFWNNTKWPPRIKHIKVDKAESGSGRGVLATESDWISKSGDVVLKEKRNMVFTARENEYAIDFSIDLIAQESKVEFGDTKEGMFALRVADWLREDAGERYSGTGRYISSNGDRYEKNIWGRRARWVALIGEKDNKQVGIVIMNHPDSVNYPTFWHARGYGLFAANPLGQYMFEETKKIPNPKKFNLTLEPGEAARFRFLVLIYEGPSQGGWPTVDIAQMERRFEQFVK